MWLQIWENDLFMNMIRGITGGTRFLWRRFALWSTRNAIPIAHKAREPARRKILEEFFATLTFWKPSETKGIRLTLSWCSGWAMILILDFLTWKLLTPALHELLDEKRPALEKAGLSLLSIKT